MIVITINRSTVTAVPINYMIPQFDCTTPTLSRANKITALEIAEKNVCTSYGNFQDMYRQRAKETGLNNIQLQRLEQIWGWGSSQALEYDVSVVDTPEKEWQEGVAWFDYTRVKGELANFDELSWWMNRLFPHPDKGIGFSDSVYYLERGFKLVAGFCEYDHGYKDAESGAIVAFNLVPTEQIKLPDDLKLKLMYENPLLAFNCKLQVLIQLGGEYIHSLPEMHYLALLHDFKQARLECSRADICADFDESLGLYEGALAAEKEDRFTNMRTSEHIISKKKGKRSGTVYIGSRTSELCIRAYQTYAKHGYTSDRLEGEFKREKAKLMMDMVLAVPFHEYDPKTDKQKRRSDDDILLELRILLANLLTGGFDFYDWKRTKANGTILEMKISDFWLAVKDKLMAYSPIRITVTPPTKTIMKTLGWLDRQVGKTLAKLAIGGMIRGFDFILATVEAALPRFNDKDWGEIIVYDVLFNGNTS